MGCSDTIPQPALLHIEAALVSTDQNFQGSNSHNVQTAWVYVNDNPIGVYEIPNVIPVLTEGLTKITVRAGVMNNGISETRTAYPFYSPYVHEVFLNPLETTNLVPAFYYKENTNFKMIADFEVSNAFEENGNESALLNVVTNNDLVFEGNRCLGVKLDNVYNTFDIITLDQYNLPGGLQESYVEMNYKCSGDFQVLLKGLDNTNTGFLVPMLWVSTKPNWHKIYIELTEAVAQLQNENIGYFQIVIRGELTENQSEGEYYWDNIKLLSIEQ